MMPVDGEWGKCVCMCGSTRGSAGIPSISLPSTPGTQRGEGRGVNI